MYDRKLHWGKDGYLCGVKKNESYPYFIAIY